MNFLKSKKRLLKLFLILIVYTYIQYYQFSSNQNSRTLTQIKSAQHSKGKYEYYFVEIGYPIKYNLNH